MPFDSFSFSSFNNINAFPSSFSFFLLWIQTTITWWLPHCHCDTMNELKWNFQHFLLSPTKTTRTTTASEKCEEMSIVYRDHENFFLFSPFQFLFYLLFTRSTKQTQAWAFFRPFFRLCFTRIFVFSSKLYFILNAKVEKGERKCLGLNRFCYLF